VSPSGGGRPTIRDVAEAAGVSVTTVSHVLNEVPSARVAAATRELVRKTAAELAYSPSRLARGLRLKQSLTLALIGDEIVTTPYAGRMIQGAQDAAMARGRTLLLFNTGGVPAVEEQILTNLGEYQVDGVIYAALYHRKVAVPRQLSEYSVVLLDCFAGKSAPPAIVPDEYTGACDAMRQLTAAGHRRIGHITIPEPIPAQVARLRAYRDTLPAQDGAPQRPMVAEGAVNEARGGYPAALSLLRSANPPTALFCFSDRMAMGAYQAAAELGLSIPGDLSVVGFDDQALIADSLFPGLTTVALPHYDMGAWSVNTLVDFVEGVSVPRSGEVTLAACPVVVRESVRVVGGATDTA